MISELSCDILVIGSGLAGLRAAYDCLEAGCSVIQVSKGNFCSGASFYPLTGGLGAQLPKDEADKETYLCELLSTGAGIASPEMYGILVDGITREIDRLKTLHIETYTGSGRPACFAKKERKLVAWRDWGRIRKETGGVLRAFPKYRGLAYTTMLRLVKEGERVTGALFSDEKNQVLYVNASAVILASGGYCGLYEYSLNTPDVAGIGQSAALDAGASLTNLEFMQFIPVLPSRARDFCLRNSLCCTASRSMARMAGMRWERSFRKMSGGGNVSLNDRNTVRSRRRTSRAISNWQ